SANMGELAGQEGCVRAGHPTPPATPCHAPKAPPETRIPEFVLRQWRAFRRWSPAPSRWGVQVTLDGRRRHRCRGCCGITRGDGPPVASRTAPPPTLARRRWKGLVPRFPPNRIPVAEGRRACWRLWPAHPAPALGVLQLGPASTPAVAGEGHWFSTWRNSSDRDQDSAAASFSMLTR